VAVGLNSDRGLIRVARSGSSGCGCTHVPDRWRAAEDGGERRQVAAVKRGIELRDSISCAENTEAKSARHRSHLGRREWLRRSKDGARRGGAERCGGEAPASFPWRLEARERPQAARVASSPSCATPGRLLDGGTATTAGISGGEGARVPVNSARVHGAASRVSGATAPGWRRLK
jgi:hypothetical protein